MLLPPDDTGCGGSRPEKATSALHYCHDMMNRKTTDFQATQDQITESCESRSANGFADVDGRKRPQNGVPMVFSNLFRLENCT